MSAGLPAQTVTPAQANTESFLPFRGDQFPGVIGLCVPAAPPVLSPFSLLPPVKNPCPFALAAPAPNPWLRVFLCLFVLLWASLFASHEDFSHSSSAFIASLRFNPFAFGFFGAPSTINCQLWLAAPAFFCDFLCLFVAIRFWLRLSALCPFAKIHFPGLASFSDHISRSREPSPEQLH